MPEQSPKDKIYKTACRLFYREGYTAVTTRRITDEAEVSYGLLSYYFGSKSGVGRLVMKESLRKMLRHTATPRVADGDRTYVQLFTVAMLFISVLDKEPKFNRFLTEFTSAEEIDGIIRDSEMMTLYRTVVQQYNPTWNPAQVENKLNFAIPCQMACQILITKQQTKGETVIDVDEFHSTIAELMVTLLHVHAPNEDKLLSIAKGVAKAIASDAAAATRFVADIIGLE